MQSPLFKQPPNSICIIRISAIGDVTHMLPIIATLKSEWPDTKITWIIGQIEYQLVKQIEGIDFIVFNKKNGFSEYFSLRKKLKHHTFDALLMMQTSLRASIISLCIKASVRLGFDKLRAHDSQSLFSNQTIESTPNLHVLDVFFLFLKRLGIKNKTFEWLIKPAKDDVSFAKNITQKKPYIVINPSSSIRKNNFRNCSNQLYASLIDYIIDHLQLNVVLTGGPSQQEKEIGQLITKQCKNKPINLIGETSLMQLLAVIKGAECIIAPDTGPAHLGTVVSTPVIGLYAGSNPLRTGPYKNLTLTVNKYPKALNSFLNTDINNVSWGKRVRDPSVMELITLEDVIVKTQKIISTPLV